MSEKNVEWELSRLECDLRVDGDLKGWIELEDGVFGAWAFGSAGRCSHYPTLEEAKAALLERVMATGGNE